MVEVPRGDTNFLVAYDVARIKAIVQPTAVGGITQAGIGCDEAGIRARIIGGERGRCRCPGDGVTAGVAPVNNKGRPARL